MLQYLVILGALVSLLGISKYIKDTLTGKTKPNRVTWLMWSIAPMIATAAALSGGANLSTLAVFMSGFGPFLVFIASFVNKNAYWKLQKFDYLCGVLSLLALILWWITKDANVAVAFAIASDALAAAPTLFKAWKFPETETVTPFIGGIFSVVTSFLAVTSWDFKETGFLVYLIVINIILISVISRKKIFKT